MPNISNKTLEPIFDKLDNKQRLSFNDGIQLLNSPQLPLLAIGADAVRKQLNPSHIVTYVLGRIINYTNVCWVQCKFCAYYRKMNSPSAYTLTVNQILQKAAELTECGGTEILFQGGLNSNLKLDYYETCFHAIKKAFPSIHIHALSPTEIRALARIECCSIETILEKLKKAGLNSIPGGGAEILSNRVRNELSKRKDSAEEWLDVMRKAHKLGIPSTATMMFGHIETHEERIEHLIRIRELQDETHGFTAFICWSFQPEDTALPDIPKATGFDYLRTLAVSRMMLDNIQHIQASVLTQGPKISQLALAFGADDLGSTMMEENVVSKAGSKFILSADELERLIVNAGYTPVRRNTNYEFMQRIVKQ